MLPRGGLNTIQGHKKTSRRVSVEAVRNAYVEHEERQARLRFLCKVSPHLKLLTFLQTTALQRKLICRSALLHDGEAPSLRTAYDCGGALPAYMPVSGLALFLSSCVSRFKFEVRFNLTIHRLDLFSGRKFPADRMTNRRTPTTPDRRDRGSRPCASHHLLSSALACCYPFDGKHYTKKRERGTSAAPRFDRLRDEVIARCRPYISESFLRRA